MNFKWLKGLSLFLIVMPEPITTLLGSMLFGVAHILSLRQRLIPTVENHKRDQELFGFYLAYYKNFEYTSRRYTVSQKTINTLAYTEPVKVVLFYQPKKWLEYYPVPESMITHIKATSNFNKGLFYHPERWPEYYRVPESMVAHIKATSNINKGLFYHPERWLEYCPASESTVTQIKATSNFSKLPATL